MLREHLVLPNSLAAFVKEIKKVELEALIRLMSIGTLEASVMRVLTYLFHHFRLVSS